MVPDRTLTRSCVEEFITSFSFESFFPFLFNTAKVVERALAAHYQGVISVHGHTRTALDVLHELCLGHADEEQFVAFLLESLEVAGVQATRLLHLGLE